MRAAASSARGSCACRAPGGRAERRWRRRRDLRLPLPETAVVEEDSLGEQCLRARVRPARAAGRAGRLLLRARRRGRGSGGAGTPGLALVWLDAHGDLNTPESSPSGQRVGHAVADARRRPGRSTGPAWRSSVRATSTRPRRSSSAETGLLLGVGGVESAVAESEAVYVALDVDVLDPGEATPFMPEPDGSTVDEIEALLARRSRSARGSSAPASPVCVAGRAERSGARALSRGASACNWRRAARV